MSRTNPVSTLIFLVVVGTGGGLAAMLYRQSGNSHNLWIAAAALLVAVVVCAALRMAYPWERAVVLRLGRFHSLRGPGLFVIVPVIDAIPYWIDTRVIAIAFKAERTLTKDTVPVDVDAVVFRKVIDP